MDKAANALGKALEGELAGHGDEDAVEGLWLRTRQPKKPSRPTVYCRAHWSLRADQNLAGKASSGKGRDGKGNRAVATRRGNPRVSLRQGLRVGVAKMGVRRTLGGRHRSGPPHPHRLARGVVAKREDMGRDKERYVGDKG